MNLHHRGTEAPRRNALLCASVPLWFILSLVLLAIGWWAQAQRAAPALAVHWRAGSESVELLDTIIPITFSHPMSDTNYVILMSPSAVTSLRFSAKTETGFTINLSAGIDGHLDWFAAPSN